MANNTVRKVETDITVIDGLKDKIVKLNNRITELEKINSEMSDKINSKLMHSVKLKGYYKNYAPDSVLVVSDQDYNDMRHAGIIY